MNKVKTCQAVCRSLKQEKFEKKQNKMSCIDVTSSFTNLKKSSFNDLIKLVLYKKELKAKIKRPVFQKNSAK